MAKVISASVRSDPILAPLGVGVAVLTLAAASLTFTEQVGHIAAVWPANAVVLAALLSAQRASWPRYLAAGFLGALGGDFLAGDAWPTATVLAISDMFEVVLCAGFLRIFAGETLDLTRQKHLVLFFLAAAAIGPAGSAIPAALWVLWLRGEPFWPSLAGWWAPDALGLLVVTPCLLALRAEGFESLTRRIVSPSGGIALLALVGALALVFGQNHFPLTFLIPPAMILVAFELEVAGTALALLLVALVAVVATVTSGGPLAAFPLDMTARLAVAQGFLLMLTVSMLPVASSLTRRRRLEAAQMKSLADIEAARAAMAEAHRFSLLAEATAGLGYWRLDLNTRAITWSDQTYRIHGLDREAHKDHLGEELTLYRPEDQMLISSVVRKVAADGEPFKFKVRLNRADDGLERIIAFEGGAERDSAGAVAAIFGVVRDVTEEETNHLRIEESEARYRLLADASVDVILRVDAANNVEYASPSIQHFGYQPQDIMGRRALSFVHPDDVAKVGLVVQDLFTVGRVEPHRDRTFRLRKADGEHVWVETNPAAVRDETGAIVASVSQLRDISERGAATQALAESETRYRLLADACTDVVLKYGLDGAIRYASPSIRRYGYEPDALIGTSAVALVHQDDLRKVRAILRGLTATGIFHPSDDQSHRFKTADGGYVWMEGNSSVVRDETGAIFAVVSQLRDISKRHAAAEALAESEARYKLLADSSTDVVLKIDTDDLIEYVSPSVRRYGYEPEALVGLKGSSLMHPDDLARRGELVRELFATGRVDPSKDRTYRLRKADGGYIWMEGSPTVVFSQDGSPRAVISQLRDITERVAANAALAESEARYRLLANNSTDLIACYGADARMTYVSPAIRNLLGYEPEELVGELTTRLTHPDDRRRVRKQFIDHLAAGPSAEPVRYEYRGLHRNGRLVWLEGQASAIYDPVTGAFVEFQDVVRDITSRKIAEAAQAESEQRYRIIAENTTDVVSRSDSRGRFLYLSPSITDVTGYGLEELLGDTFLPYTHPDDVALVMSYYERLVESGHRLSEALRYRARHKDGRWIWLECHPTLLRGASGGGPEFIDITRDITRTARLEAELTAARDAAETAAQVKSTFVANMSHEIRTPLTAIMGFTRLLADRPGLDQRERSYVDRIAGAGRALMSVVNDVLDFSKLEAGQFEIRPQVTAPAEVIAEALMMFTPQADAKDLALAFEPDADLPDTLLLDPDRLRQILLNLIGNAVKFTERGGVTVAASYQHATEALEIRVSDTGPGMSQAQQRKLFQRFSQVDGSAARTGGTGLGLAICKGLAEAMGGDIAVSSRKGGGSVFRVRITAVLADAEEGPTTEEASASIEGLRLLLVDDNATNRELARAILAPFGVEVTEAADGVDAVSAALASPFDAILMDIRMPRLDGPGAAARIRNQEGPNRDVPILAFSADGELSRDHSGFVFDGVVHKPLAPAELIGGLQQCL